MQIKSLLCVCAFAAASFAQVAHPLKETEQESADLERSSIISVLSTALPASLLEYNTDYGASGIWNAANHDIFTATQGHDGPDVTKYFPEWVTALPSDVQTYLDVDLAEPTVTTFTATSFVGHPVAWDEDLEDEELASVGSVLATAVPASIDGLASTDPYAYQSAFDAELEPGGTYADWVTALPSDVQTLLVPGGIYPPTPAAVTVITVTSTVGKEPTLTFAQGTPNTEGALPSLISQIGYVGSVLATALPQSLQAERLNNEDAYSSHISSILDPDATSYPDWVNALPSDVKDLLEVDTGIAGMDEEGEENGEEASETSKGGAAMPTNVVGMGVAGAVGLVGLLTL